VKTSDAMMHELDEQEAFLARAQALSASPLVNLNFLSTASKPAAAQPVVVEEVKIKPGQ
jgi:hypothetical protein